MSEDAHTPDHFPKDDGSNKPVDPEAGLEKISMDDYTFYDVYWCKELEHYGWGIWRHDGIFVFGVGNPKTTPENNERIKALCQYWAYHLNLAYAAGFMVRDLKTVRPTKRAQEIHDELFKRAFLD